MALAGGSSPAGPTAAFEPPQPMVLYDGDNRSASADAAWSVAEPRRRERRPSAYFGDPEIRNRQEKYVTSFSRRFRYSSRTDRNQIRSQQQLTESTLCLASMHKRKRNHYLTSSERDSNIATPTATLRALHTTQSHHVLIATQVRPVLDGRQQLAVKAAEIVEDLPLVWVRVDLQGVALQGQHEDAPAP